MSAFENYVGESSIRTSLTKYTSRHMLCFLMSKFARYFSIRISIDIGNEYCYEIRNSMWKNIIFPYFISKSRVTLRHIMKHKATPCNQLYD